MRDTCLSEARVLLLCCRTTLERWPNMPSHSVIDCRRLPICDRECTTSAPQSTLACSHDVGSTATASRVSRPVLPASLHLGRAPRTVSKFAQPL